MWCLWNNIDNGIYENLSSAQKVMRCVKLSLYKNNNTKESPVSLKKLWFPYWHRFRVLIALSIGLSSEMGMFKRCYFQTCPISFKITMKTLRKILHMVNWEWFYAFSKLKFEGADKHMLVAAILSNKVCRCRTYDTGIDGCCFTIN